MSVGTCCVPGTRAMPGGPAGGEDSGAGGSSLGRWPGLSCVWQGRPRPEPGREEWVMASLCRHVFLSCIKVGLPCSDTGSSWGRRGRAGPGLGRVRTPPTPSHGSTTPAPASSELLQLLGQQSPVGPSLLGPTAQLWGQITDGRADELRAGGGGQSGCTAMTQWRGDGSRGSSHTRGPSTQEGGQETLGP